MTTTLVLVLIKQRVCQKSYTILTSCFGESDKSATNILVAGMSANEETCKEGYLV